MGATPGVLGTVSTAAAAACSEARTITGEVKTCSSSDGRDLPGDVRIVLHDRGRRRPQESWRRRGRGHWRRGVGCRHICGRGGRGSARRSAGGGQGEQQTERQAPPGAPWQHAGPRRHRGPPKAWAWGGAPGSPRAPYVSLSERPQRISGTAKASRSTFIACEGYANVPNSEGPLRLTPSSACRPDRIAARSPPSLAGARQSKGHRPLFPPRHGRSADSHTRCRG